MDASDVVGLARVATCSRALHDLFSDGAVRASLERSRVASNRANISEAHLPDLRGMLHEVAAHRDAAVQERDELALEREEALESARVAREHRHEVSMELRATVREQVVEGGRMRRLVRQLEQALADSQRELAEAKRARVD